MSLNKVSGNMYPWVTHTWNPVGGECPHRCSYCYIRNSFLGGSKYNGEPHLVEKELTTDLGDNNFIFVGSATDIFAHGIDHKIIESVLEKCKDHPENRYLFQSKNPGRIWRILHTFGLPKNSVIATTIETNRENLLAKSPSRIVRQREITKIAQRTNFDTLVSVEPVLDFDIQEFTHWLWNANPSLVSIGADSRDCDLPEPPRTKLVELYKQLDLTETEIKLKKNLKRIWDFEEDLEGYDA